MNIEAGIWKCEDGVWFVRKRYKGVDWSGINWSEEAQVGCPYCMQEFGGDTSQDNFTVYGLNDEGMANGGHCWSCSTTIVSVEKAIEDEQNKSSTDGKVLSSNSLSKSSNSLTKKSNIGEESKVSFASSKVSKDQQKLNDKRLTEEQIAKIHSETSDTLKVNFRGLDKDVCKSLDVRWKYDDKSGKVTEMWCPTHIIEDAQKVLVGYHIRIVRDRQGNLTKDFRVEGYNGKLCCFFGQQMNVKETLVIVGGQIDVISAIQMYQSAMSKYTSRIPIVVSTQLGEPSTFETIKTEYEWVSKFDKVILCLDQDQAGVNATDACKDVLDADTTLTANLSLKDVNCYLQPKEGKTANEFSQDSFWKATPSRDFGVVDSSYLFEQALEKLGQEKIPFPKFLKDLAKHFTDNALNTGSWVNFIAGVSSGKSTILDSWTLDWALNSPYRQAILSYEANAKAFGVKVISLATSKAVLRIEGKENRIEFANQHKEEVMKLLVNENGESRFDLIDKLPTSVQEAKDLFTYLVKIRNVKVIVIDPLVDFLTICRDQAEQEELIIFMDNLRMSKDVTFMLALHTRKNLSNGANTSKGGEVAEEDALNARLVLAKGTVNITSWRNKDSEDEIERNTVYLSIKKNRDDAVTGVVEKLFYRFKANKLYPYSYAAERNFFNEDNDIRTEDIIVEDDEGFSLDCLGVTNVDQIADDSDPELNF